MMLHNRSGELSRVTVFEKMKHCWYYHMWLGKDLACYMEEQSLQFLIIQAAIYATNLFVFLVI